MKAYNDAYEAKFGHIFIVCATGKSADQMLDIVKARCRSNTVSTCKSARRLCNLASNVQAGNNKPADINTETVCRYDNQPHAELLIAASEQMKITELRLLKILAAVQQEPRSPASTSERRAGLVLNHLRGAQTLRTLSCCQPSSRECLRAVPSSCWC